MCENTETPLAIALAASILFNVAVIIWATARCPQTDEVNALRLHDSLLATSGTDVDVVPPRTGNAVELDGGAV